MKRLLPWLLPGLLLAHDLDRNRKPSKADPVLKKAKAQWEAVKKKLTAQGKYACCIRPACNLCAKTTGSCACAVNIGKGKGACGECLGGWKAGRGALKGVKAADVKLLPAAQQSLGKTTPPAELNGAQEMMLEAKRQLAAERRYSCCVKGGCDECALEASCPCGGELAKGAQGKGVCGTCLDGWHGGQGAFPGVELSELKLAEMEGGAEMQSMREMMSPGIEAAGWYASGSSQMPRESTLYMLHGVRGNWRGMLMGQGSLVATQQSSARGGDKLFAANWVMPMASRRLGPGVLTLRSMFSLEPLTVTGRYYPLLFQAGETAFGIPIVDGQHPHDFVMELGASYQWRFSERLVLNVFAGPRGEPALGPTAYPHRLSASENPMAVLSHHYMDSTHIANQVVTAGLTAGKVTVEGSGFNGREPDERRWGLERGGLDSYSGRVTVNWNRRWTTQFSLGRLTGRESLHPDKNSLRASASVSHFRPINGGYIASLIAYGANRDRDPGHADLFQAVLAESTIKRGRNWFWGRYENTDKDSFIRFGRSRQLRFEEEERFARVAATTLGYERELPRPSRWLSAGLGGQVTFFRSPREVRAAYGATPVGAQLFLRFRLAR